jgi:hypothetical protein
MVETPLLPRSKDYDKLTYVASDSGKRSPGEYLADQAVMT